MTITSSGGRRRGRFPLLMVALAALVFIVNPVLSARDAARWLGMESQENVAIATSGAVPPAAEADPPEKEMIMSENSVTPDQELTQQPVETSNAPGNNPSPIEPAAGGANSRPGGSTAEGRDPAVLPALNDKEDSSYNPYRLAVKTPAGVDLSLDLSSRPALLVSVRCSSCSDVLEEVSRLPGDKRPYIISLYLRESEKGKMGEKMSQAGLPEGSYYTAEAETSADSVSALLLWTGSSLETVEGISRVIETLQR